jgi:SOS response regulatory protein OraA/RecX
MTTLSQTLKNNFYFKRVVKYCSLNLRSESELNKKLSTFEHMDREVGEEIKSYFLKSKIVLPDEDFIDYYISNLSENKGYSFNQLYLKLGKKISDKRLLKDKLQTFMKATEETQVSRFIIKNKRKILKKEPSLQLKYLQSKGYSYTASKKALSQFLSENSNL